MLRHVLLAAAGAGALAACSPSNDAANQSAATTETVASDDMMANDMGGAGNAMVAGNMAAGAQMATAQLRTAQGQDAGTVTATQEGDAIRIRIAARNLPAGARAGHVHAVGRCDAPSFESATGHWNPDGRQHGSQNPAGPHAGDGPNITVAADGTVNTTVTLPHGTLAGMLDTDGASFIIHTGTDDYRTDPTGNAGGRLACGVFAAG